MCEREGCVPARVCVGVCVYIIHVSGCTCICASACVHVSTDTHVHMGAQRRGCMQDECNSSTHCRLGVCKMFLANPLHLYNCMWNCVYKGRG